MDQPPPHTGAEELVQANIRVEDLGSAMTESDVLKAVQACPGVQSAMIVEGELHVVYDPLQCSEHALEALVLRSGHRPLGGEAHRDSPFA